MKNTWRTLWYARHYWLTALGAFISLFIVNTTNLATPQLLRVLIDQGIQGQDLPVVFTMAGSLVGLALIRGLFNFLQGYWTEVTSQGVAFDLRNSIFEKLQRLSFSYHDKAQTGKLMVRMTSDVEMVRMFAGTGFLQLISAVILLVGTLVILFSTNVLLTFIFLGMLPAIGVIFVLFIRRVIPISKSVQIKLGNLNTVLQENLAGVRVVKAFAREEFEEGRFNTRNLELLGENVSLIKTFANIFPLIFLIANLGMAVVLWAGGLQVIGLQLSLGELVAFQSYQIFLLMPIFMLGFIGSSLSRAEVSAQRLFEVIDAKSEVVEKPGAIELKEIDGRVVFEHVSFRFFGDEQDVISDLSFEASPNQSIAILGKTGSGKSTIINLIPRFYDVTKGRVLIDGHDIRDVSLSSLRRFIGIVLQETTLFSGTLRENIAYGKLDASEDEIIAVAKAAQAHDFITQFPDGYLSIIGERGVGLSGGQKQRIAIARALLLNPKILIMDDSTSSVDAETEYHIQMALDQLIGGRTTFIIAQRISTIRNANLILLLDEGKLVAKGTHEELIDCCELYTEILQSQFGGFSEPISAAEEAIQ